MKNKCLQDIGELALIQRICRKLPQRPDVVVGPGDDCAVVRPDKDSAYDWLLKSDPVIEGIHVFPKTPGRLIGHKALGRVLSDLVAMGGEPMWALVDIVAPSGTPAARVDQVMQGISALARKFQVAVVGVDVSAGLGLEVHIFVVGRVEKGKAILRSGAKPGDNLFVTGSLGGSLAGKHLRFMPRLKEGRWLCRQGWARAMIDLSDGLATDLRHLIHQSRVGAQLFLNAIPVSPAVKRPKNLTDRIRHALSDGEDYELLFAVSAVKTQSFQKAWQRSFSLSCTRIGTVTKRQGVIETVDGRGERKPLKESGYEHFK